jgi:tRNA (guanine-N7-)-methyltransferase
MKPPEAAPTAIGSDHYRGLIAERYADVRQQMAAFLPPEASFVWELGSGHGHFLAAYAQAHPEKLCVGVDIASDRVERAVKKRDRAKLPNLHFIRSEARLFLEALPPDATFSEIFVLFPDPWPKLRHHKHRIMQSAFLDRLGERAHATCRLFFRTDHQPYFEATESLIAQHPRWRVCADAWPFEYETVFQRRAPTHHSLVASWRS